MSDITYKYNGSGDYYGDPFTVRASWPPAVQKMWVDALARSYTAQAAPWEPTYETLVIYWPGNDGTLQSYTQEKALQFPTMDTCQKLADMYGATVVEAPFLGEGPVVTTAKRRSLQWANKQIEAWPLANAYTNNPPDLANKMCLALIGSAVVQPSDVGAADLGSAIGGIIQLLPVILQLIASFQSLFGRHPKPTPAS